MDFDKWTDDILKEYSFEDTIAKISKELVEYLYVDVLDSFFNLNTYPSPRDLHYIKIDPDDDTIFMYNEYDWRLDILFLKIDQMKYKYIDNSNEIITIYTIIEYIIRNKHIFRSEKIKKLKDGLG